MGALGSGWEWGGSRLQEPMGAPQHQVAWQSGLTRPQAGRAMERLPHLGTEPAGAPRRPNTPKPGWPQHPTSGLRSRELMRSWLHELARRGGLSHASAGPLRSPTMEAGSRVWASCRGRTRETTTGAGNPPPRSGYLREVIWTPSIIGQLPQPRGQLGPLAPLGRNLGTLLRASGSTPPSAAKGCRAPRGATTHVRGPDRSPRKTGVITHWGPWRRKKSLTTTEAPVRG